MLPKEDKKRLKEIKEKNSSSSRRNSYPDEWNGGELDENFYKSEYLKVASTINNLEKDFVKTKRIA